MGKKIDVNAFEIERFYNKNTGSMSPEKIYKNNGVVFERQFASIKTSINDNSKGIFCLGWKNALGALATQNKRI